MMSHKRPRSAQRRPFLRAPLLLVLAVAALALVGQAAMMRAALPAVRSAQPAPAAGAASFERVLGPLSPDGQMEVQSNAALPEGTVRRIAIDALGTTWLQIAGDDSGRGGVYALDGVGRPRFFANLREAAAHAHATIGERGQVADFWAVDRRGRVWVGPAYYDGGGQWVEVARDVAYVGGALMYESRAVADANGLVWVPYHVHADCYGGAACGSSGVRAFDESGALAGEMVLPLAPEMAAYGLPAIHLVATGALGTFVAAGRSMRNLESGQSIPIESLRHPETHELLPGYVTAAGLSVGGAPTVYVTSQRVLGDGGLGQLRTEVAAETWMGDGQRPMIVDLGSAPLFAGRPGAIPVAAQELAGDRRWVASSHELAVLAGSAWAEHYDAENSPLSQTIYDIAVQEDGTAWVAAETGVRVRTEESDWMGSGMVVIEALDGGYRPNWFRVEALAPVSVKLRNLRTGPTDIVFALGFTYANTMQAAADGYGYANFQAPAMPGAYEFGASSAAQRAAGLVGIMQVVDDAKTACLPYAAR